MFLNKIRSSSKLSFSEVVWRFRFFVSTFSYCVRALIIQNYFMISDPITVCCPLSLSLLKSTTVSVAEVCHSRSGWLVWLDKNQWRVNSAPPLSDNNSSCWNGLLITSPATAWWLVRWRSSSSMITLTTAISDDWRCWLCLDRIARDLRYVDREVIGTKLHEI